MSFRFHNIPLVQCKHQFLKQTEHWHKLEGKDLIAMAKNTTANLLSRFLHQELIGDFPSFFTKRMENRIFHQLYRKIGSKTVIRERGLALLMSLLQTKRWIDLVPSSFIESTLQKHKTTLTGTKVKLDSTVLQELEIIGELFGRGMAPLKMEIPRPTSKSTFESPRCRTVKDNNGNKTTISAGYRETIEVPVHLGAQIPNIPVRGQKRGVSLIPIIEMLYGKFRCSYHISPSKLHPLVGTKENIIPFVDRNIFFCEAQCICHKDLGRLPVDVNGVDFSLWMTEENRKQQMDVKPVALPEPLKVRVITKANAFCYLLKLIQEPMTAHLNDLPVFCLTGSPLEHESVQGIQKQIQENPDKFFISGDYDAATDNLPLEAIQAVMYGILKGINMSNLDSLTKRLLLDIIHLDTIPHRIHYPIKTDSKYTHIWEIVQQTRGQLMGSLLSFPVLCLVNYLTVLRARGVSLQSIKPKKLRQVLFKENDIRINGDDLLFADTQAVYQKWKQEVHKCGLLLSVGKNYVSREFGTINSRLLSKNNILPVLRFGDLKSEETNVLQKWESFISNANTKEDFERMYSFFIHRMKSELSRTNQNLILPKCLGGPLPDHLYPLTPLSLRGRIDKEHALFHMYKIGRLSQGRILLPADVAPSRHSVNYWQDDQLVDKDEAEKTDLWVHPTRKFISWLYGTDSQAGVFGFEISKSKIPVEIDQLYTMMNGIKMNKIRSEGRIRSHASGKVFGLPDANLIGMKPLADKYCRRISNHLMIVGNGGQAINFYSNTNSTGYTARAFTNVIYCKIRNLVSGKSDHKRLVSNVRKSYVHHIPTLPEGVPSDRYRYTGCRGIKVRKYQPESYNCSDPIFEV
jgi:hypothetical protein